LRNPAFSEAVMLKTSVGQNGGNNAVEVKIVQILLNHWLGDSRKKLLRVDGIAGPLTIGAIKSFQAAKRTGSDGRIDPAGPTIKALAPLILDAFRTGLQNSPQGHKLAGQGTPRGSITKIQAEEMFVQQLRAALSM
jgi:peptidoglycan hydrolase-like protein with peptidoglycan-binding domain